jgi:hypothetical protein
LSSENFSCGNESSSRSSKSRKRSKKEKIISLQAIQKKHQFLLVLFLYFSVSKLYITFAK